MLTRQRPPKVHLNLSVSIPVNSDPKKLKLRFHTVASVIPTFRCSTTSGAYPSTPLFPVMKLSVRLQPLAKKLKDLRLDNAWVSGGRPIAVFPVTNVCLATTTFVRTDRGPS